MHKTLTLLIACLSGLLLQAQEVISASGESLSNADYTLHFTLGEMVTESYLSDAHMTQGFQQPNFIGMAVRELETNTFTSFPNPSTDWITIESETTMRAIQVLDAQGRVVAHYAVSSSTERINLETLPSGSYFLQIDSPSSNTASQSLLIQIL